MRRKLFLLGGLLTLTLLGLAQPAWAAGSEPRTFWSVYFLGGKAIGWVLIAMDVASIGFIIQSLVSIRRVNIAPPEVHDHLQELIENKQYRDVIEFTESDPTVLSHVVKAGLNEASHGFASMERAMEEAGEERTSQMLRKIEVLNIFGNIGPMLGLLGTVYGMIGAFNQIVQAGGVPDPAKLADNIGLALVTTFWGLVVAIPAMAVYGWLKNRIDGFSAETALAAQDLIGGFRPTAKKA